MDMLDFEKARREKLNRRLREFSQLFQERYQREVPCDHIGLKYFRVAIVEDILEAELPLDELEAEIARVECLTPKQVSCKARGFKPG